MPILRPWSTEPYERKWAMGIAVACFVIFITLPFLPENNYHTNEKNIATANKQITPVNKQKNAPIKIIDKAVSLHTEQKNIQTTIPIKPRVITSKNTHKNIAPASSQGYFIQAGAFKNQSHAQKLQKQLIKKHWPVMIQKKKSLYAVQVGPYKNKEKANKIKQQLFSKAKINGFITHHAYP